MTDMINVIVHNAGLGPHSSIPHLDDQTIVHARSPCTNVRARTQGKNEGTIFHGKQAAVELIVRVLAC